MTILFTTLGFPSPTDLQVIWFSNLLILRPDEVYSQKRVINISNLICNTLHNFCYKRYGAWMCIYVIKQNILSYKTENTLL